MRGELGGTEGFFDGRSSLTVFTLGLVFMAVLGVLDFITGPRFGLALFYLMPVGLVTWNLGRRLGVVAAVVATGVGLAADVVGPGAVQDPISYWNAIVRCSVFLVVTFLLASLKHAMAFQRDRADREHDVSVGLRELNEAKNTLLHAVSHDLKGPLAGIIGAMQTLRRGDELELTEDEVESLHSMIELSGRRMNRLVDDMLDLERIDRGQVHPDREPTDVGELARRVAREATGLEAHPITVEAEPVLVDVDAAKVERIIENLLVNAARHTPVGTPVRVAVRRRPKGIVLTIEDRGPGVPAELKDVLFDPFRQGPSAGGRGVGIGLSLVRRFAELHGGTAVIEDREGGGARFVITLPGTISSIQVLPQEAEAPAASHLRAV